MTLRGLMELYNMQEEIEYIAFEFSKRLDRREQLDPYTITKIKKLFQELLSFEKIAEMK